MARKPQPASDPPSKPSPPRDAPHAFWPSTRVTWVNALSEGGEAAHYRMLVDLALRYRTPILRRIMADAPDVTLHDAEDLCSDYFHVILMGKGVPEKSLLHRFDRSRSRLRTFLSVTLSRFLSSWKRHRHAARRDARLTLVSEEVLGSLEDPGMAPDALFDRFWGQTILTQALAATEARWTTAKRAGRFEALKPYLIFHDEAPALREIAARLEIAPDALRQSLLTLRREFKEEVLRAIDPTLATPQEQAAEFRHLMDALRGA